MNIREATHADVPAIARMHVEGWRATYKGIVPDEFIAELTYEMRERQWHRALSEESLDNGVFCYVAEDEPGQIVGFVSGGPERTGDVVYKGELYSIYLLQPYQGQGVGHRLMSVCVDRLLQLGFRSMLVWVITANPTTRFYEALGGQQIGKRQEEIRGTLIDEVAYGWKDITPLKQSQPA